jgi:hypothetical protein
MAAVVEVPASLQVGAKYSSFRLFQLALIVPGGTKPGVRCSQLEDDRDSTQPPKKEC